MIDEKFIFNKTRAEIELECTHLIMKMGNCVPYTSIIAKEVPKSLALILVSKSIPIKKFYRDYIKFFRIKDMQNTTKRVNLTQRLNRVRAGIIDVRNVKLVDNFWKLYENYYYKKI